MADVTPLRTPGIGHNLPPEPVDITPGSSLGQAMVSGDPAIVQARLERQYEPLVKRFIELDLGLQKLPAKIASEEEAERVLNWVAHQCTPLKDEAQKAHDHEKRPYLAGAVVDRFFNAGIRDKVTLLINAGKERIGAYRRQKEREQRQREEAARRAALEEQRRAEAEFQRLAREAQQKEATGDRRAAVDLTKEAEEQQTRAAVAQAIVEAPAAPVRLHGEFGATAFAVKRWRWDVVDPDEIEWRFLKLDDAAIQKAIDAGERELPGLELFEVEDERIRRC
jgi:hypothetical protein